MSGDVHFPLACRQLESLDAYVCLFVFTNVVPPICILRADNQRYTFRKEFPIGSAEKLCSACGSAGKLLIEHVAVFCVQPVLSLALLSCPLRHREASYTG